MRHRDAQHLPRPAEIDFFDGAAQVAERIQRGLGVATHFRIDLAIAEVAGVEIPRIVQTTTRMSWFVYVVRVTHAKGRDAVMAELESDGVPSRPYFTPLHLQPFYAERFGYARGDFPVTEELGDTSLALPFSSTMTREQVDYVCAKLIAAVGDA